jgi:uncharacterized protein (DUF58 family)
MLYPTRLAILVMAAGAPISLLIGLMAPGLWLIGAAWIALVVGLTLLDGFTGATRAGASLSASAPASLGMGARGAVELIPVFDGVLPRRIELAAETNDKIAVTPNRMAADPAAGPVTLDLEALRRGEGVITRLWMRWTGPMGLAWRQVQAAPDRRIAVVPNIRAVQDEAIRLFSRDALFGQKIQLDSGDGSEFHALRELVGGMDLRTVDWKSSARHIKLLGKEYRTERNHPVIFAIDTGRLMCEPVLGIPRIDRSINAALLLAFVSLKLGDRAGFFGFDDRPRLFTGAVSGSGAFPLLQRLVAALDYSPNETNYTLGLTQLGSALERRSLVVVFTDFDDSTSGELMIENVARLMRRHLVLFVVIRDEELEAMARAEPETPEDVSRAVTADALLREREVVVARLRRLGAQIVDAPVDRLGPALLNSYLDLKRRELL